MHPANLKGYLQQSKKNQTATLKKQMYPETRNVV